MAPWGLKLWDYVNTGSSGREAMQILRDGINGILGECHGRGFMGPWYHGPTGHGQLVFCLSMIDNLVFPPFVFFEDFLEL